MKISRQRRSFLFGGMLTVIFAFLSFFPAFSFEASNRVEFITGSGPHQFSVEVMRTRDQWQNGLMHRRSLPENNGMLFLFNREAPVSMWMKDTYIPLDIVFIGRNGRVLSIAANTEPMSERVIPGAGPIWAVIELNAGAAARIGLNTGDQVRNPAFFQ